MAKQPNIDAKELVELAGGEDEALFFLAWIKHDRNATAAYESIHPNITHGSAQVGGHRMLMRIKPQALLAYYNLGPDRYLGQLSEGLDATKWNDFTGEREPDHNTRAKYHDKLGKLLGLEQGNSTLIQVNAGGDMSLEFFSDAGKAT